MEGTMAPAASTNSIPPRRTTLPRRCTISSTPVVATVTLPPPHQRTPAATSQISYNSVYEQQWWTRVKELEGYKGLFGHTNVPQLWQKNRKLGEWVQVQRKAKRRGQLKEEREKELHRLGFEFDGQEHKWRAKLKELKAYKSQFGHTNVPQLWQKNKKLGAWVNRQRKAEKQGQLEEERKKVLHRLGFEFDGQEHIWRAKLKELKAYKSQFGHTNAPRRFRAQRNTATQGRLSAQRKRALDDLGGFEWTPGHGWTNNRNGDDEDELQPPQQSSSRPKRKSSRRNPTMLLHEPDLTLNNDNGQENHDAEEDDQTSSLSSSSRLKRRNRRNATSSYDELNDGNEDDQDGDGQYGDEENDDDDDDGEEDYEEDYDDGSDNEGGDSDLYDKYDDDDDEENHGDDGEVQEDLHAAGLREVVAIPAAVAPTTTLKRNKGPASASSWETSRNHSGLRKFSWRKRARFREPFLNRNPSSSMDSCSQPSIAVNQVLHEEEERQPQNRQQQQLPPTKSHQAQGTLYNEDEDEGGEENHEDDGEVQGDLHPAAAARREVVAIPAAIAPITTLKRNKGSESASSWKGNRNHPGGRKLSRNACSLQSPWLE